MDEGTQFLVTELERLLSLPLDSKAQIEAWYAESERVQRELPERYPDLEYPHEVWHFLADADIRARDAGYRQYQEKIMTDYIRRVRDETRVA
jgi:hypothetical protein